MLHRFIEMQCTLRVILLCPTKEKRILNDDGQYLESNISGDCIERREVHLFHPFMERLPQDIKCQFLPFQITNSHAIQKCFMFPIEAKANLILRSMTRRHDSISLESETRSGRFLLQGRRKIFLLAYNTVYSNNH